MNQDPTITSFTSLTLLGRVRDLSNQQAWEDFVRTYAPRIFSWCKRFSLQDHDASDVTQQVLMKLVDAMRDFDYDPSRGSFRGWLKTVTANAVRDLCRKRSWQDMTGEGARAWIEALAEQSSIDSLAEKIEAGFREELVREAESRVQIRVKPQTWKIYQLLAQSDVTPSDVAQQLNVKISDVYVAKSRVIKMLKETVGQLESLS